MNPETHLLQSIRLALAQIPGVIVYRNAIGYDLRAKQDYGIMNPGGPDLVGWVTETSYDYSISEIARFLGIEVKTHTGIVSPDQRARIKLIRDAGGYAGVSRSVQDAIEISQGIIHD